MSELTLKQFQSDIFAVNPEGDAKLTYDRLMFHLTNGKTNDDSIITYEEIKQKYEDYIKVWYYQWGRKEKEGFLPKDKARQTLYDFLGNKGYNNIYQLPKMNIDREEYLFGTTNRKELYDRAEEFTKKHSL